MWAVRVVAKDGAEDLGILENDGLSEIRSFRTDRYCPVPTGIKASAERGYIQVEWDGSPEYLSYAVSYRLRGSEEWREVSSSFPSAMLSGVRGGNTYEYRVAGFCEAGVPTYNNTVGTITLPSEDTARMRSCGLLRPVDLSNQSPLEDLSVGDQFLAGDFPVTVMSVSGSQGYFTGVGSVNVPFLANGKFKVTFDNIYVNTDRRMIRGVVNTVYDADGGGIADLDDIFVGGSETGKVVSGITFTDLSADFVIGEDSEVYFDEGSDRLVVKDSDGSEIGYIEVGSGGQGDAGAVGGTGNEASVFPMTVKDKEGNIYRVDDVPGEEDVPDGGSAGGSSVGGSSPKKLVVTPVGKSGERLSPDELNVKRLDSDIAEVVFRDVEGSVYAFDGWKDVYRGSILIREKYEQLGQNYHVASKLVPSGKSDVVGAEIRIVDKSVDPEKVVFRTAEGTEFSVKSFDKRKGRYVLTVVGGKANDGQEVYALYPKKGGGYYNLGKLLVVSYPEYKLRVKIVPLVKDFGKDFSALRQRLESVYGRVGISCEVTVDDYFEYDDPLLFDKGSGLLSAYNSRMKALNGAYSAARGVDDRTSYIFITEYCGQGGKRDFSGFMPLNSQFGYVARGDFRSVDKFCIAVAHELAHGRLSLRHPFDKSLGLSEGDVAENLMDYRDGTELAKWQWDVIHDPGVVIRVFERDKDALKVNEDGFKVQEALRIIRLILTKDADYRFRDLNVLAKNIQIGNNKYQKIKINTVSGAEEGSNSPNMISFENLNIELSDKGEAEKMRDFLYGIEKDIYGKSDKKVVLNGEEITLDVISGRMEEILLNLLNSHKYDQLTYAQKVIMNIPIIQWKLGYYYGAAFMYCWFNGENRGNRLDEESENNYMIKIGDQNFTELFKGSDFFGKHLTNTIEEVENGYIYNVPSSLKCLNNIKKAIETGQNLDIHVPIDYEKADQKSSDYGSFLYSHAVSFYNTVDLSHNTVMDDDFAYAIGSFAILVSMEGRLEVLGKDAGIIRFSKLSYRLWDTFDFAGDQLLGNWNADVFDATKVSLILTNVSVGNKDFRDFYQAYTGKVPVQGKTPWDFDIVTKNHLLETDLSGLRYNIDAFGTIKSELIK